MTKTIKKVQEELQKKAQPQQDTDRQNGQVLTEDQPKDLAMVEPAQIDSSGQLILTPKHKDLIKAQIAPTATKEELELFFMMAYRTRLDPLMKQLYFIKYDKKDRNGNVIGHDVSYVTSIDGYRIIAARTGQFMGTDEPRYEYNNGMPTHCTVTVYRLVQGIKCAFTAKVAFREYSTGKNLWINKPETMIAKVAEAHALRKAFPQDLSGVYTQDEMDQVSQPVKPPEKITQEQIKEIRHLLGLKGLLETNLVPAVEKANKMSPGALGKLENFTKILAEAAIRKLRTLPDYQSEPDPSEEEEVNIDIDEIDKGIENMKNDANPGADFPETIQ